MTDGVFIAMPVYRGAEVIDETIRSILDQEYDDFHLVMSVDGADDPSVEVCRKYTSDPRIGVVVQEERLGWPGNFNWLVDNCDREFFCYWQQDDLATTGYLGNLRRELLARPDAAIAHSDVQWFGASFDRTSTPSIEGDPLSRVMQHIEAIRYEPLRGLMRSSMLPQDGPAIPVTEDESCQEEFVFLTHMAAQGAFVRTGTAMYFKRLHASNVFKRWFGFPDWRRRRGWLSMGSGMYHIARRFSPTEAWPTVLAQIADRLAVSRVGRGHFYLPPQHREGVARFVRDFVDYSGAGYEELGPSGSRPGSLERPVNEDVLGALQQERINLELRAELEDRLDRQGAVILSLDDEALSAILGFGWSDVEPWGVWTDGGEARLRIPAPAGRAWRATLAGRVYAPNGPVQIGVGSGRHQMTHSWHEGESVRLVVEGSGSEGHLLLDLPDASAPLSNGVSDDSRMLCFAVTEVRVDLT
ncbi:MAG TPA: glycosyltransferase [Acidimicrobiia bacterium]|nr:glycosyltransferase [Acidimicrobiia bacterium]